ncbi:SDR family NAD(P)-dependent oxidoreductase [Kaistia terrae]|uniref:SDR family NAD(P)-dependent oxidoreductase n=1 Tax=Kaistia terrae TaxID=537017 RepID=A0ABW0PTB7_9HYPH|nr:SDR family NAD(P)-dependent oxidoreductase [Kaistia terrae]
MSNTQTSKASMSKIWLITGSAHGLGRSIVEAALAAGDCVVATARNPERLGDLEAKHGGNLRSFALDVTDAEAAQAAVDFAIQTFGRLDVLVNNAGYGHLIPFEQTDAADFRAQIDTNFYGVVNLTRAALPAMRRQRAGHIINISSVGGRTSAPGMAAYQAAKWAVGGFTEVIAKETASFGVKIVAVEPGGMRTAWAQVAGRAAPDLLPDYEPTVGALLGMIKAYAGNEVGDPARIADVVVDLAGRNTVPAHLILGSDALHIYELAEAARQAEAKEWAAVSASTDFEGSELSILEGWK